MDISIPFGQDKSTVNSNIYVNFTKTRFKQISVHLMQVLTNEFKFGLFKNFSSESHWYSTVVKTHSKILQNFAYFQLPVHFRTFMTKQYNNTTIQQNEKLERQVQEALALRAGLKSSFQSDSDYGNNINQIFFSFTFQHFVRNPKLKERAYPKQRLQQLNRLLQQLQQRHLATQPINHQVQLLPATTETEVEGSI